MQESSALICARHDYYHTHTAPVNQADRVHGLVSFTQSPS